MSQPPFKKLTLKRETVRVLQSPAPLQRLITPEMAHANGGAAITAGLLCSYALTKVLDSLIDNLLHSYLVPTQRPTCAQQSCHSCQNLATQ